MAERLALSPSYFQTLYRAEFGVSCYEDVLRAKTRLAQYYLANTTMTVREISGLCGFENDVHFMRQFRKRTGLTALEYRRISRD
jgi:AraC family transcriptional regulator of arabinose operon